MCLSMLAWSKRFGKIIDAKVATDILYTDRIINTSSLSVDWSRVFSPNGKVYILGNTQYVGARMRSAEQTAEFDRVFSGLKNYRDIDYSGAYIYQAAKYMREHDAEASFIVTNSLTQGSQAGTLWPLVFDLGIHISFGWQSFKLQNLCLACTTLGSKQFAAVLRPEFVIAMFWDIIHSPSQGSPKLRRNRYETVYRTYISQESEWSERR